MRWTLLDLRRKLIATTVLVFYIGVLASGCGQSDSPESKQLVIGYVGSDEYVAVSNLTKLLLEEELGEGEFAGFDGDVEEDVEGDVAAFDVGTLFHVAPEVEGGLEVVRADGAHGAAGVVDGGGVF